MNHIKDTYNQYSQEASKFDDGGEKGNISDEAKLNYLKGLYNIDTGKRYFSDDYMGNYEQEYLLENPITLDARYKSLQESKDYVYAPYGSYEVKDYAPLKLETYYPIVHPYYDKNEDRDFKWTGHSAIINRDKVYTKTMEDPDYNLLLNNCSDETRRILEAVFNKRL